jgi:glutamine synthetase
MCAISLPTPASYARVADGVWSGGTYVSWGTDNRETPVRLTGPPESPRFELRAVDGTACPYLVLASAIAAGLEGLRTKRKLEVADSYEAPATLTPEGRSKLGITGERVPSKIEEARKSLSESATMKKYLGEELITKFLSVNEVRDSICTRALKLTLCPSSYCRGT